MDDSRAGRINEILLAFILVVAAVLPAPALGRKKKDTSFKLAGGTETLGLRRDGTLEVGSSALIFRCPAGTLTVPYASINLMEYRYDLSQTVRKMKLNWVARPTAFPKIHGQKKDRFFTVVYDADGVHHALIFEVLPEVMEPYLAEIELKSGKRVNVESFEQY